MSYSIQIGTFDNAEEADKFIDSLLGFCKGLNPKMKGVLKDYIIVEGVK